MFFLLIFNIVGNFKKRCGHLDLLFRRIDKQEVKFELNQQLLIRVYFLGLPKKMHIHNANFWETLDLSKTEKVKNYFYKTLLQKVCPCQEIPFKHLYACLFCLCTEDFLGFDDEHQNANGQDRKTDCGGELNSWSSLAQELKGHENPELTEPPPLVGSSVCT